MSPKHAVLFASLSGALLLMAYRWTDVVPGASLGYLAISAGWLAAAYGGAGPGALGKRPDGRRSPWAIPPLVPYFALNALIFRAYRRLSPRPPWTAVAPRLFLGRRPVAGECSERWPAVLDLAAEFPESRTLRAADRYLSLPVLDATAPTAEQLERALSWLDESISSGPVYVHCALGHGRSASVVIAHWLRRGVFASVEDAEAHLGWIRPGVRLNRAQRARLRDFEGRASSCGPGFGET